jgi:hypothetical protein
MDAHRKLQSRAPKLPSASSGNPGTDGPYTGHNPLRVLRLVVLPLLALGLLLAPRLADTALVIAHNDRVHYVGHLVAGRVFSLCPCTLQIADTQYLRGMYHARTPQQAAWLTTDRPASLHAQLGEARTLAAAGLRHLGRRLSA